MIVGTVARHGYDERDGHGPVRVILVSLDRAKEEPHHSAGDVGRKLLPVPFGVRNELRFRIDVRVIATVSIIMLTSQNPADASFGRHFEFSK